jgi:Helix-hairpin-helix motif
MKFSKFVVLGAIAAGLIGIASCISAPIAQQPASIATTMAASPMAMSHGASHAKLINLNGAILSDLDKLEAKLGIPALSNQIQAARPYGKIEELVEKKVLTQAQFDQVKAMVTIEDIVLTGEAKDVDYVLKLGLMKGHMMVAKELLDLGKPDQAEPHIGHPVEEIYVDIEDQLKERNVADFKGSLVNVQDLVKSKPDSPELVPAFDSAVMAIDGAIAAIKPEQLKTPTFGLQVINGLLETALAEYTAAIANGKIAQPIEYQDSRGFIAYARETLLPGIAPNLKPDIAADFKQKLMDLSTAWPSPIPPAVPVLTPEQVATTVKSIEKLAQTVLVSQS